MNRALISWALYDCGSGAYSVLIQTFVFATYFVAEVAPNKNEGAAIWGLTIGFASLFIALLGPLIGSLADQGGRKTWLGACTFLCAGSCLLSWFVYPDPSYVTMAMVLLCTGTIGSEFAYVFYNAMLPELAPKDKIGLWSGWGWGMGYGGGIACLTITLAGLNQLDYFKESTTAAGVRASFILAGLWLLLFSFPVFFFTPKEKKTSLSTSKLVKSAFKELLTTLSNIHKYTQFMHFFLARMFYNDALTTLFAFGGIYAATEFNFSDKEVLLFGIGLNITAGIGAVIFSIADDVWGSRLIIITSLVALIIMSSLALYTDDLAIFWLSGLSLGVFVGPIQASSRSYLAKRVPPELRNQMFGFFTMTGRATAFLGPTLVGWLTYVSGNLTVGMSVITVFFFIGLVLILILPSDRPQLKIL